MSSSFVRAKRQLSSVLAVKPISGFMVETLQDTLQDVHGQLILKGMAGLFTSLTQAQLYIKPTFSLHKSNRFLPTYLLYGLLMSFLMVLLVLITMFLLINFGAIFMPQLGPKDMNCHADINLLRFGSHPM